MLLRLAPLIALALACAPSALAATESGGVCVHTDEIPDVTSSAASSGGETYVSACVFAWASGCAGASVWQEDIIGYGSGYSVTVGC